jgi:L-lactate dehydrogenase complex protein LldG
MNRDAFLARIREAAAAGRRFHVPVRRDLTHADGRADTDDDVVDRYVREATNAGGRVTRVDNWSAARDEIDKFFRQYEPRSALCWRHPTLDQLRLADVLEEHGIEKVDYESLASLGAEQQRAKMLATDVGITSTTWAVAETGSLLCAHGPMNERLASLVPPVHLAVVERKQIVADLFDAFAKLGERLPDAMPSNATFITGPSKTGDIETKLVTGVHGPGKWHLLVVDAR